MRQNNPFKLALAASAILAVSIGSIPARASDAIKVGDVAPDFKLNTLDGRTISLNAERSTKPVVLVVLRGWPGYQCPVCTAQAGDFISHAEDFKGKARIIMVYPGPAEALKAHADDFLKNKSWPEDFLLVLDPDYTLTKAYGLRWEAPKETAYPSTFVIDALGKIRFAKISRSHGGRAAAEEILRALDALK